MLGLLLIILLIILFVVGLYFLRKGFQDRNDIDPQTSKKGNQLLIIGIVVLIVAIVLVLPVGGAFH